MLQTNTKLAKAIAHLPSWEQFTFQLGACQSVVHGDRRPQQIQLSMPPFQVAKDVPRKAS